MRYAPAVDPQTRVTTLTLEESSHTDALPLVSEIFFSDAEFDVKSGAFALACLILTRSFVGEEAEFAADTIGIETVRAARRICPWLETLSPIDGLNRSHSTAEFDIACAPARLGQLPVEPSDVPLLPLDWSGDFVEPGSRSSAGFRFGRYFTNAGLVADDVSVSIAIGLMHGGSRCRNLHVPLPARTPVASYEPVVAGLSLVGIGLRFAPPAAP